MAGAIGAGAIGAMILFVFTVVFIVLAVVYYRANKKAKRDCQ